MGQFPWGPVQQRLSTEVSGPAECESSCKGKWLQAARGSRFCCCCCCFCCCCCCSSPSSSFSCFIRDFYSLSTSHMCPVVLIIFILHSSPNSSHISSPPSWPPSSFWIIHWVQLCYPYIRGHPQSLADTGWISLIKDPSCPRSHCLPIAPQLRWWLVSLPISVLQGWLAWCSVGLEQTAIVTVDSWVCSPIISRRHSLALVLPVLWLSYSFHSIFHKGPWALGKECDINVLSVLSIPHPNDAF